MANEIKKLGFVQHASIARNNDEASKSDEKSSTAVELNGNEILIFDSGKTITNEDANHHLIVLGATGSSKTTSVMLPILNKSIKQGFGGFIVDIKGSMTPKVIAMAKACNREKDVYIIGSEKNDNAINLLEGMDENEIFEFFVSLISNLSVEGDHNRHFHMNGVNQATQCAKVLLIMSKKDKTFMPSIKRISELCANYSEATEFFQEFITHKEKFVSEDFSLEQIEAFIKTVQGNSHHVMNAPDRRDRMSTYLDQLNYAMKTITIAFDNLMMTPGIAENFCGNKNVKEAFDMSKIYKSNAIIVLRFSPVTGSSGERIARYMAERFYQAVFMHGLKMPKGKYVFVCYDEFQTFADLSNNRYSDAGFVDKAREFNAIFIGATQSMSALVPVGGHQASVDKFISNCNCRVVFYSDDPSTQSMVSRYSDVKLNELEHKAFVIKYNAKLRKHESSLESLQNSYESIKPFIDNCTEFEDFNMRAEKRTYEIPALKEKISEIAYAKRRSRTRKTHQDLPIMGDISSDYVDRTERKTRTRNNGK